MASGLLFVVAVSLLFVPWVYGIYALARDVRNRALPTIRRYRRNRAERRDRREAEREREDRERQLY